MKMTAAYMEPRELNRSCLLSLKGKIKYKLVSVSHYGIMDQGLSWSFNNGTYTFLPRFRKIVPKMRAITIVKNILVAVYDGFLQYDLCCFHRQAIHCVKKDCAYWFGKHRSVDPGGGVLSSLIRALFLLP
jgi:hypothetical protein